MPNYPLVFMEALVGGVLISQGVPMVKRSIGETPVSSVASSSSDGSSGIGDIPNTALTGPEGARKMLEAAEAQIGASYLMGGGHGSWITDLTKRLAVDCSGFVSHVLHAAGFLSSPVDTTALPNSPGIEKGHGQWVTIWNRPLPGSEGHVIINILGRWFESAGSTGVHEMDKARVDYQLSGGGYLPLHPRGL